MIAYLKGEILEVKEDGVIIVCSGVGYEVNLARSCALELSVGQEVALYIAESISPYDGTVLYGFLNKEDKELWLLFKTAIPNTGPKKAMEFLNKNESLIVYPDIEYTAGADQKSDIYDGFLFLGELYFKKTGKHLKFIPIYINEKTLSINECDPVVVDNFKKEKETAKNYLVEQINK